MSVMPEFAPGKGRRIRECLLDLLKNMGNRIMAGDGGKGDAGG